jgi:Ca-activated chloride channel family protein
MLTHCSSSYNRRFFFRLSTSSLCAILLTALPSAQAAIKEHVRLAVVGRHGKPSPDLPLTEVSVQVRITGSLARTQLTHVFSNPYPDPLEAIYSFPLPHQAAVTALNMKIGSRVIHGIVQEREAARKTYEKARQAGQTASLVEQQRPNVFTQWVGNIRPGEKVSIVLTYVTNVDRRDGAYEMAIPTTIGPRYLGDRSNDGGQEARLALSGPVRSARDAAPRLNVEVNLTTGMPIRMLNSPSHPFDIRGGSLEVGQVMYIMRGVHAPDRDVLLTWRTAAAEPKMSLLTHRDAQGNGTFLLQVEPPWPPAPEWTAPRELIFVVDCSGSQEGAALEASRAAVLKALDSLREGDTFQIVRFEETSSSFASAPVEATAAQVAAAKTHVRSLVTGGGTELAAGLQASLGLPPDPSRLRIVAFFTDGQIGNEREVISQVRRLLGPARLFMFGCGSSTNRFLIDQMARVGRGAAEYLAPGEDAAPVVDRFERSIARQAVTDLALSLEGGTMRNGRPDPIPDLLSTRPAVILGRFRASAAAQFTLSGRVGGRTWSRSITASQEHHESSDDLLPVLWARAEIDHWLNDGPMQEDEARAKAEVTRLGLSFGLMTPFTSLVAVEERSRVSPGGKLRVERIPVVAPHGSPFAGNSAAAPEPAAWALMLIAMAIVAFALREQERGQMLG